MVLDQSLGSLWAELAELAEQRNSFREYVRDLVTLIHTLVPGCTLKIRNMASSAASVLPDPVGAPSSTL